MTNAEGIFVNGTGVFLPDEVRNDFHESSQNYFDICGDNHKTNSIFCKDMKN